MAKPTICLVASSFETDLLFSMAADKTPSLNFKNSLKVMLPVERLLINSIDKNKLDKIYLSSIEETKLALKKKSS